MSEYEYYEFRALDRALTREERTQLRRYSTRAQITATGFTNHYEWGSFKGDVDEWMDRFFDAFLYLANWGTRELHLRMPTRLLDPSTFSAYCRGGSLTARDSGQNTVLAFQVEEIESDEWLEGDGQLASMLAVREELLRGDLRSLYLGWLMSIQSGQLDEGDREPPVPSGLTDLTVAQQELIRFFDIDEDLVTTAAQASPPLPPDAAPRGQIDRWVAGLSPTERDELLSRLVAGEDPNLGRELHLRAVNSHQRPHFFGRTAGELLGAADVVRERRKEAEAKRRAAEQALREREAAVARAKYLDSLVGRESAVWKEIEALVATKVGARYDEAVARLTDLRDLAERGDPTPFRAKMQAFRDEHTKKPALIQRLYLARL